MPSHQIQPVEEKINFQKLYAPLDKCPVCLDSWGEKTIPFLTTCSHIVCKTCMEGCGNTCPIGTPHKINDSRIYLEIMSKKLDDRKVKETKMSNANGEREIMQIFMEDMSGQTMTYELSVEASFLDLKAAFVRRTGVSLDSSLRVVTARGKTLYQDHDKLSDFGVGKHSTLRLLGRLKGGKVKKVIYCL